MENSLLTNFFCLSTAHRTHKSGGRRGLEACHHWEKKEHMEHPQYITWTVTPRTSEMEQYTTVVRGFVLFCFVQRPVLNL